MKLFNKKEKLRNIIKEELPPFKSIFYDESEFIDYYKKCYGRRSQPIFLMSEKLDELGL